MTLLKTAQGLEGEQLDAWLGSLSPEERAEFVVQVLEAWMVLLDSIISFYGEASDGEVSGTTE